MSEACVINPAINPKIERKLLILKICIVFFTIAKDSQINIKTKIHGGQAKTFIIYKLCRGFRESIRKDINGKQSRNHLNSS